MYRLSLFVTGFAFVGAAAFAQTSSTDSQTLQALLAEIRQLRQDLQTTTVAAQRTQIVLYRLQVQESAALRAAQKLEDARSKLARAEESRKKTAGELQKLESVYSSIQDANVRKQFEQRLQDVKTSLEMWTAEELQLRAKEAEAQGQVRSEQLKLAELQDWLDRLDKSLENLGARPGSGAR